jgi:hypothetical protein
LVFLEIIFLRSVNSLGIKCIEKNIEPYDIYTADEAFMTGTPFCVLPVFRFNETKVGNGKFGKITKKIIDKWSENVGVDIINQIKNLKKNVKGLIKVMHLHRINFLRKYKFVLKYYSFKKINQKCLSKL